MGHFAMLDAQHSEADPWNCFVHMNQGGLRDVDRSCTHPEMLKSYGYSIGQIVKRHSI